MDGPFLLTSDTSTPRSKTHDFVVLRFTWQRAPFYRAKDTIIGTSVHPISILYHREVSIRMETSRNNTLL